MRLKIILISITLIAAGILSGCAGSKSINGPDAGKTIIPPAAGGKINSGLLLGLAETAEQNSLYGTPAVLYRTLWISPGGTGLDYLEGPGFILTPYESDFWKIENSEYHFGPIDESYKKFYGDKIDYDHNLVMFASNKADSKSKPLYTNDTFQRPYSDKDGYTEWDIQHQRVYEELIYAGNNYACIKRDYLYDTGGTMRFNGYSIGLYQIGNLGSPEGRSANNDKQLTDLLPAGASVLVDSYSKKYDKTIQGEFSFIEEKEVIGKDNPGLQRIGGKWEAVVPLNIVRNHFGNGSSSERVKEYMGLSLPLPISITSHDSLYKSWEEIKQKYPDAKDAVSSPDEDMLVILTPKALMVFANPGKGIDKPCLSIDVDESERIILNQWATGKNVEIWSGEMRKYLMKAQESKDYAAIKDREKRTPYAGLVGDDYKRIIPLDELAGRIAATYKFITAYPDSPYKEEMTLWKSEYLHDYLFGNFKYTASFEWMDGSNIFLEEHLNSYGDSKEKYKSSAFGSLLDEYVNLVNSEGNMMTDKVRDFVEKNSKDEQVVFQLPN